MSSGPVSIASSSSAGAAGGSVINVSALVSQLVAAAQGPQTAIIAQQTTANTTQISAVGTLKGALSTFQSALAAVDTPAAFNSLTAKSSNNSIFTASTSSGAVSGTYSISISQLAQGQQIISNAFSGGSSATVGTGTLQLSLGGASFNVAVNSDNDTLSGIAGAINSASGNPGITATVITGTGGAHLALTSTLTGATNTIQVSETDGGTSLSALTYGPGNTSQYTQQTAPQDAQFSIANIAFTSASNTVTNALSGVTLQLSATTTSTTNGTTTDTPATLTLANDTSTVQGNISSFVQAYNTLVGTLSSLGSFDQASGSAGPLLGSALLAGVQSSVRSALDAFVNTGSSTYNSLASIGITSKADGTLSLNSASLNTALSSQFSAVSQIFSGTNGVAATLNTQLTAELAAGGPIDQQSQTLSKESNALTDQTKALKAQLATLSASLTQQYSALDTLLSSLQRTSSFLTQQFDALSNSRSNG
jgi:flagellar hook-associated protein 2